MSPRKPASPLEQLAAHDQRIADAAARVRAVEAEAHQASAEAARIAEELTEAFATGDKAAAEKLTRAKATAEATAAEPWTERIAGAQRAAARVASEADAWLGDHFDAVIAEVAPDAEHAATRIEDAARELSAARDGWHVVAQRVATLSRRAGQDPRAVPMFDAYDRAILAAANELAAVPRPLPVTAQTVSIPDTDSPDEAVRMAARARAA